MIRNMIRFSVILVVIILFASCATPVSDVNKDQKRGVDDSLKYEIKLDYDSIYQTIVGFGASGAWWAQHVGAWESIDEIMRYLYCNKTGLGLNIYRYNIGAGRPIRATDYWRMTQTVEVSPGVYDLSRDENAINAMKKAVYFGADTVVLFAKSPPARLTKSGFTSGGESGGPNLPNENETEFAKYLVDITEKILNLGMPVKYLSPINEPQWAWKEGQEGSHFETEQVLSLSRKVALELERRKLPVRLSINESGKWNDQEYTLTMIRRILDCEILSEAINHFAVHSYWSNERDKKIAAIFFSNIENMVPLYQTEWCEMEWGRDFGMDAALVMARTIHEDMTILSVSSWSHWLAVSRYDYRDGLIYVDVPSRKFRMAKRGWVLGNFARFIEKGYKRIGVSATNSDLLVSAYKSPQTDKTVIIAINPKEESIPIKFLNIKERYAKVYETSENHDLELVDTITLKEGYIIPARSVVSFVVEQ